MQVWEHLIYYSQVDGIFKRVITMKCVKANSRALILAKWSFCCLFTLVTAITNQAGADDALTNDDVFAKWEHASDGELDALRGGFVLPNGINIDFNIEKVILLNGVITSSTNFQLPENMSLLQNGMQNVAPALQGSALGSVIQNNLDNQVISTMNTINIELSNLKNLDAYSKGIAFQNYIQPQLLQ